MQGSQALLAFAGLLVLAAQGLGTRCWRPQIWSLGGAQPMIRARGRVTVVALFKASSPFCQVQAVGLETLRGQFAAHNMPDIDMFIINDYSNASIELYEELISRVSFPVYQDTPQLNLWTQVYGGDNDDFFIFDRCGQMTFHISLPHSNLNYHYTESAIYNTYHNNICNCRMDRNH